MSTLRGMIAPHLVRLRKFSGILFCILYILLYNNHDLTSDCVWEGQVRDTHTGNGRNGWAITPTSGSPGHTLVIDMSSTVQLVRR